MTDKRDNLESDWPRFGVVEFTNVTLVYREGLEAALRGVTFCTKPGERIGIVGECCYVFFFWLVFLLFVCLFHVGGVKGAYILQG